jgi:hypothetical protein
MATINYFKSEPNGQYVLYMYSECQHSAFLLHQWYYHAFFFVCFLEQPKSTPANVQETTTGNNNNVDNEIIKFILQLGYFWS